MIERKFVVLFNGKFFLKAIKGFIIFIVGSLCIYSILVIKNELSRSSGEIFLIPENYIGFIYIIYNEKEGGIEKENGIYTYKIPASGIYRTSLSFSKRLHMYEHTIEFYFIGSDGKRKFIPNYTHGKTNPINDSSAIIAVVKSSSPFVNQGISNDEKLFKSKPYFIYQIDSLKNHNKEAPPLTKLQYENSKIKK